MKSEKQIEADFIEKLKDLKYTYRADIRDRAALEANFKTHFERLNRVRLSDAEFARLKEAVVTQEVFDAAQTLREMSTFKRDDDTPLQYTLVNIRDWCKNEFEVVHQLRMNTENSNRRYDVIILMNGVPVVQVELKTLQISPKRAMEQIVAYKNDPGNGYANSLLCFIQLFIVSNESQTFYFANNAQESFCFDSDERFLPVYEMADENNETISHLHEFAQAFLPKRALGQLVSRYMVLVASERRLLIMRPYQIYAVQAIMDCIDQNRGNGYIWHTTGSGKTLTSFKASTLLKDNPAIAKCLFVVDRKDLDRQTRLEFNKFQEGCVEENTNTESLVKRLASNDYRDKVIVTTIQKLGLALDEDGKRNQEKKKRGEPTYRERLAELAGKRVVIIFDECHRSQFGDNHEAIKQFFPKAQLFGFTGTPIFDDNATYRKVDGTVGSYVTTKDVFQKELHAYTITNAIEDGNVLRFHIDYFKQVGAQAAAIAPGVTKQAIVEKILAKHDAATHNRRYNALFATASINDAIEYFELFQSMQEARRTGEGGRFAPLNVCCVFSPPAEGNKDVKQLQEDLRQEKIDNEQEPERKKAALQGIMASYNRRYGANHSVSDFDLYYQDVQKRIKDQQYPNADYPHANKIDITIVVDMLLTGFDSKYLNTLYVDKNLKQHGLIQAFSRTNRILNGTKPYGNILDFRGQRKEVDDAIKMFSGKEAADRAREIWLVAPPSVVIDRFDKAVAELERFMASQGLAAAPEQARNLKGDAARSAFVSRFKEVQRLKTQLDQYTDIDEEQAVKIEGRLPEDALRAFRGAYIAIAGQLKASQGKEAPGQGGLLGQLDLELVLFSSAVIDYDYIMALIARYTQPGVPKKERMSREQLIALMSANSNMMEEREDIAAYVYTLEAGSGLDKRAVEEGYRAFKNAKMAGETAAIANKHGVQPADLQAFADEIIERMIFDGERLSDLFAPLRLGWRDRVKRELALMDDFAPLLKKIADGRAIAGLDAYE